MKKILTYIFSLCLCIMVFAGCSLVQLNASKYYKQTVAEIVYSKDKTYEFTMEDLLQAYNNYGYQLAQNNNSSSSSSSSMTGEEILTKTAELMVQRHLLVEMIKEELGDLSTEEKNYIKRQTYDSINSQLASLEDTIRVEWDRKISEDETKEDESTSLRASYTAYEPTVEKVVEEKEVNGTTKLVTELKRVTDDEEIDGTDPGEFKQVITDEDISKEAWKRYMKTLQDNNENLGKKYSDEKAFEKEIDRIYNLLVENRYISKYQTAITNGLEITAEAAVENYKEKYKRDYEKYANDEAAYHSAMSEDASSVYYHPNSGNEYIYVTHILFKFSDEQTAKIANLKKMYQSNSISKEVYETRLEEVQSLENTVVKYEENGVTKTTSAALAYQDVLNNVGKYDKDIQFEARAKEFNTYIYKYNDDEGIMNKDFAYVVNLDTSVTDKMVKSFADESRRLQKEEGVGAMSKPILTDYGYHIILNLGPVKNVVEYENIDNITWETLYNVKTQPSSEKTLFHVEYDAINTDSTRLSQVLSSKTDDLMGGVEKVRYWDKRILSLLKQSK